METKKSAFSRSSVRQRDRKVWSRYTKFLIFVSRPLLLSLTATCPPYASTLARPLSDTQPCGIWLATSADPPLHSNTGLQTCVKSYRSPEGAVVLLADGTQDNPTPAQIENIPMLHIRNIGIDGAIKHGGDGVFTGGQDRPLTANAPGDCHLKVKTIVTHLQGANWRGWLVEDRYTPGRSVASSAQYCSRYAPSHRCVRLLIGNARMSATMAQYCLSRDPDAFDEDAGPSYDSFERAVKTIRFVEE